MCGASLTCTDEHNILLLLQHRTVANLRVHDGVSRKIKAISKKKKPHKTHIAGNRGPARTGDQCETAFFLQRPYETKRFILFARGPRPLCAHARVEYPERKKISHGKRDKSFLYCAAAAAVNTYSACYETPEDGHVRQSPLTVTTIGNVSAHNIIMIMLLLRPARCRCVTESYTFCD